MKFVPNSLTRVMAKQVLSTREASPRLLFVAGVIGVGATVVLASKATLKVESVLDEHDKRLIDYRSTTSIDAQRTAAAKMDLAVDLGKLYLPAVACGVISVTALASSNHILTKRNAALTAAYAGLERVFNDYRDKVREELGPEKESELYLNLEKCEIEDEDGKKRKTKRVGDGGPYSLYAKLFDDRNINWSPVPETMMVFLKLQQNWANERLQAKGYLFLNEVYDALGIERTPAGQVVGWMRDENDGFVDFGIFTKNREQDLLEFMAGREGGIWLDFNVDGVIYKKI